MQSHPLCYQSPTDLFQFAGLIYGAAIGDAIGIATQWMSPDESRFHYDAATITYSDIVTDEHRVHWKRGDWVSNFDQTALVLESLVHWAGVVDELDFAKSLHSWSCHGFQELGDKGAMMVADSVRKVGSGDKGVMMVADCVSVSKVGSGDNGAMMVADSVRKVGSGDKGVMMVADCECEQGRQW